MSLNERNRLKLEKRIREHEFEHALPYLLEHTRQGIRCAKSGQASDDRPGSSRIGGDPALPSRIEWPVTSEGVPMTFLTQLNLKEFAAANESSLLPASGMLYFFVGVDEPAYNIEHRVIHVPEEELASVSRRLAPGTTALEEAFRPYRLEPRATLEPPNYAYVDTEQVENDTADYEDYEELIWSVTDSRIGDVALLFGYPDGQHGDAEYEAALMILTGETITTPIMPSSGSLPISAETKKKQSRRSRIRCSCWKSLRTTISVFAGGMPARFSFSFARRICWQDGLNAPIARYIRAKG